MFTKASISQGWSIYYKILQGTLKRIMFKLDKVNKQRTLFFLTLKVKGKSISTNFCTCCIYDFTFPFFLFFSCIFSVYIISKTNFKGRNRSDAISFITQQPCAERPGSVCTCMCWQMQTQIPETWHGKDTYVSSLPVCLKYSRCLDINCMSFYLQYFSRATKVFQKRYLLRVLDAFFLLSISKDFQTSLR